MRIGIQKSGEPMYTIVILNRLCAFITRGELYTITTLGRR
jgi:hypothetical protein